MSEIAGVAGRKAAAEQKSMMKMFYEAFGAPDLADEGAGAPPAVRCLAPADADGLAAALCRVLGDPLEKSGLSLLAAVLARLPAEPAPGFAEMAVNQGVLLEAVAQVLAAQDFESALPAGRQSLTLIFRSLVKAAAELRDQPGALPWCDLKAIFRELMALAATPEAERGDAQKEYLRFLTRVLDSGVLRRPGAMPDPARLLDLLPRFPNFEAPIRFLAEQAAFAMLRGDAAPSFVPILLVGSAGVGKTHFALALSEILGERAETLSMSAQTSGFTLSGLDRGWSSARPGMIFEALMHGETLSPLVVLDEIDKANNDSRSSPLGPLYTLLEPRAARAFRDEYAAFGINAAQVFWVATANDAAAIPAPLLSRFRVFDIPDPDESQLLAITAGIYREACRGIPGVPAEMPVGWRAGLAGRSMRDIRIAIQQALGRAALRAVGGRQPLVLEDGDLAGAGEAPRRRIGFVG